MNWLLGQDTAFQNFSFVISWWHIQHCLGGAFHAQKSSRALSHQIPNLHLLWWLLQWRGSQERTGTASAAVKHYQYKRTWQVPTVFSLVVAVLVVEVLLCADQDLAAASLGLWGSLSINQLQYIKGLQSEALHKQWTTSARGRSSNLVCLDPSWTSIKVPSSPPPLISEFATTYSNEHSMHNKYNAQYKVNCNRVQHHLESL